MIEFHVENLHKGDIVAVDGSQGEFRFLWFHDKGIDLQPTDNINIFHIPFRWFGRIKKVRTPTEDDKPWSKLQTE